VSRVLRGRQDRIPETTRKKVLEAAERLGYRPNLLIQGVQTGRTMNIGVIIPSTGSFYSEIVHGIHDELRSHEYCVLLAWNPEDTEVSDSSLETELIHHLLDRRVDGIILRPTHAGVSDVYFSEVMARDIPLVTVDRPLPGVHCDFVGTDDELGGRLAAQYLLQRGCRNLVHLAVASTFAPARLRQKGFEEECTRAAGTSVETVQISDYDLQMAQEAIEKVLSADDRPDAIFVVSDNLVQGVYRAAGKLKLRVPEDVAVVGFGNLMIGEWIQPSLTTIDQNPYEMGRTAARQILARIQDSGEGIVQHAVAPELVERDSASS
ncbi:LacI family DNA-binding transcriptional regulator, partial [Pontiellaceae bacterium B12227]|nr:LacI family DNA-binding transcriptional regulator [Pontiellaceae bacterium B12227]